MSNQLTIGLDLYALDAEYIGGINTFALGLMTGLLNAQEKCKLKYKLVIIASAKNKKYIKSLVGEGVEIIVPKLTVKYKYINRMVNYCSWIFKEIRLRYWMDKVFRKSLNNYIQSKLDALIVPTTVLNFYGLNIPTILCIHDIQQEYFPENFTKKQLILRWMPYRLSAFRASIIQVSSNYIKTTIIEKFDFTLEKVFLIAPEGVDPERFSHNAKEQKPTGLDDIDRGKFLFYPAQLWKHKNHTLLIRALAEFRNQMGFEMPCVLTGHDYGCWAYIDSLCKKLNLRQVAYLGKVEINELIWCYKNALSVLALGKHESSSLPVREAAIFGKPLICSNIPPNIEISSEITMQLFNVDSSISLKEAITDLYYDDGSISSSAKKNMEVIKKYYWDKIAKKYVEKIYSEQIKNDL